jgi:hypothetical protein
MPVWTSWHRLTPSLHPIESVRNIAVYEIRRDPRSSSQRLPATCTETVPLPKSRSARPAAGSLGHLRHVPDRLHIGATRDAESIARSTVGRALRASPALLHESLEASGEALHGRTPQLRLYRCNRRWCRVWPPATFKQLVIPAPGIGVREQITPDRSDGLPDLVRSLYIGDSERRRCSRKLVRSRRNLVVGC